MKELLATRKISIIIFGLKFTVFMNRVDYDKPTKTDYRMYT